MFERVNLTDCKNSVDDLETIERDIYYFVAVVFFVRTVFALPAAFSCFDGGITRPAEITNFAASSTVISNSKTSFVGTNSKKPDVGLGVVGKNTEVI